MADFSLPKLLFPFAAAYLSAFILIKLALKLKIIDIPSGKKIHKEPTPLLGGVAIFLGTSLGLCLYPRLARVFLPIFIGATLILIVNLIDDIRGLPAYFRLFIELIIALAMVLSGIRITFFPPGFWGDLGEIIITLVWLVGITNAFNYLDGMDGLATGSAAINTFYFAVILLSTQQPYLGFFSLIVMASSLGFLPHNFKKAKIFLGDAGSTFLGFIIACIGILGSWADDGMIKISIPLLVLGVPIFDMIFTTVMRIRQEKVKTFIQWLKWGGRDHFHHYLVNLGLLPLGAVLFIWTISASLGLSAIMIRDDKTWEAVLTLLQASVIFAIIGVLIVVGKRHRSGWGQERKVLDFKKHAR